MDDIEKYYLLKERVQTLLDTEYMFKLLSEQVKHEISIKIRKIIIDNEIPYTLERIEMLNNGVVNISFRKSNYEEYIRLNFGEY